tara:strand:- start:60 stop:1400 length:1341 start_codon:yes stop_codon:yes gene_type:complete
MNYLDTEDNIVALATASGLGSIDVIRISGNNLSLLFQKITKTKTHPKPNIIKKHTIYSLISGDIVDTGMLSFFSTPASFTGQDIVEINCHGGGYIANTIIDFLCLSKEVRLALPGEFLFRAYMNNKVDLIQAESINEMISSESGIHNNKSLENIDGKLSEKILIIKKSLINLLLIIEHELDFDESEILHINNVEIGQKIKDIIKHIDSVSECYFFSKTVRSGLRVLMLGKPNVGKSSIYNHMLGVNRSIVADIPGTTRDTIESILEIGGHKIVLIDSAGSWESIDEIESMGIAKTKDEVELANIIILVGENDKDITAFNKIVKNKNVIVVMSKNDIHNHKNNFLSLSTENSHGFSELLTKILTGVNEYYSNNKAKNEYLINRRQHQILKQCNNSLKSLLKDINLNINRDVLAELLHIILDDYNNIIDPVDREDIINNIFSGFCVGK